MRERGGNQEKKPRNDSLFLSRGGGEGGGGVGPIAVTTSLQKWRRVIGQGTSPGLNNDLENW
jgi:hypothetical protein